MLFEEFENTEAVMMTRDEDHDLVIIRVVEAGLNSVAVKRLDQSRLYLVYHFKGYKLLYYHQILKEEFDALKVKYNWEVDVLTGDIAVEADRFAQVVANLSS